MRPAGGGGVHVSGGLSPPTDPPIYVSVWKVAVGRVSLYLMDTDIQINDPWNRGITARLYIGDLDLSGSGTS